MSQTITPNYTDTGQTAIAIATLARNGTPARGTVDLSSKRGAWFFPTIGRQGTTALTTGIQWAFRRTANAGGIEHPSAPFLTGDTTAAVRTTCATSGNTAGVQSLAVAATTSFAAGDLIFIDDTGNVGLSNSEWARVSSVIDSTHLQLDAPTQFAHNSASAHVSNHADIYPPVWVDGGCTVEVIADYGASTTGDTEAARCLYASYDHDTVA